MYGAGINGQRMLEKIERQYPDELQVTNIIDQYKSGKIGEISICSIEKILEKKDKDTILSSPVVIAIAKRKTVLEVYRYLNQYGFSEIYFYLEKDSNRSEGDSFLEYECAKIDADPDEILPHIEIHAVDYCNLNCSGCTHFSPAYDRKMPNITYRLDGIKKIRDLTANVLSFYILGGEPFLCQQLEQYINTARTCFPNSDIRLVTNGLLITTVNQSILDVIREKRIIVDISEYEPVRSKIHTITEILSSNLIDYSIRTIDKKQRFTKPLSTTTKSKYKKTCISDGCVSIKDDMISRCPTLMYVNVLNEKYHTSFPLDGIYKIRDFDSPIELNQRMKERVPLCEYCVMNEIDWHTCGKKPDLYDFVTDE